MQVADLTLSLHVPWRPGVNLLCCRLSPDEGTLKEEELSLQTAREQCITQKGSKRKVTQAPIPTPSQLNHSEGMPFERHHTGLVHEDTLSHDLLTSTTFMMSSFQVRSSLSAASRVTPHNIHLQQRRPRTSRQCWQPPACPLHARQPAPTPLQGTPLPDGPRARRHDAAAAASARANGAGYVGGPTCSTTAHTGRGTHWFGRKSFICAKKKKRLSKE